MSDLLCAICEKPATCVGRYLGGDDEHLYEPACDECCGHGCEDGHCVRCTTEDPCADCEDDKPCAAVALLSSRDQFETEQEQVKETN
jgi:hypothetical protein